MGVASAIIYYQFFNHHINLVPRFGSQTASRDVKRL